MYPAIISKYLSGLLAASPRLIQIVGHLALDPLNGPTATANALRHLEDAVTDTKLLPDPVLDLASNSGPTERPQNTLLY